MSNNLVSQPLSIPNKQMDPISDNLEVSIPNMRMGMMDGMSNSPAPRQFEISNKKMGLVEPMTNNFGLHNSPVLNRQTGQMEMQVSNLGLQQFLMPNHQIGDMDAMLNNIGSQKILLPSKRKAVGEPKFGNSVGQHLLTPNRNVAQMEPFTNPGLQQLSSPNKRTTQVHSKSGVPSSQNLPPPNKKMVRNESISGRSGTKQLLTPKNRTTQMEPSPKGQVESCESVRSKMRESLASALALVTQRQDKASNEESNSEKQVSQRVESSSAPADAADHVSENPTDSLPSKESRSVDIANNVQSISQGGFTNENMGGSAQTWKGDGQEVQYNTGFPNEDVSFSDSFFVKDELLQGNGLTWALELDVDVGETKEVQIAKKPKLVNEDVGGGEERDQAFQSPQSLAFKIEVELFKLFGGVNKKYKEKGRSLMFNLKDRSNPELRERVMSGEIPPDRLCSMTAEELASKELSEWRIAKAEELAQMVVLPDSEVDMRRLVKKTHKGEFQVEFEQDDGVSVEVSVGASSLLRVQLKDEDTEAHPSAKADDIKDKENVVGEKSSSENQDLSCSLTIPNDGTDLMQNLMVDELKDAEFLPPIVSLDEFMESLDSEPPFENLPMVGGKTISPSVKETTEGGFEVTSSGLASKEPVDATSEKFDKVDVKYKDSDVKTKSKENPIALKPSPGAVSKGDRVWEGILQLNVSAVVTVVGFFKSGEKTSTKEWPNSLEIKGRVRLDAFEKFLQELPMSRSRAVMVVHFVLKEGSSENDHASLDEVVHSYVSDERLGFAAPATGVELYICPPRIVEILSKHLSKDHTEILNSIDNGLIGIVVWRRPHFSSSVISPNSSSSSHHKHNSKKQHSNITSRKHQEKDTYMNVNFVSKPTHPMGPTGPHHPPINHDDDDDDDDDDIPPGFGPATARDEDDLPEFNFSKPSVPSNQTRPGGSGTNPSYPSSHAPPLPVDQMRELIQKYGQTGNSAGLRTVRKGIQPWNDDDDDDIPEWQPQAPPPQQQPHHQPPMHNFQQPMLPHHQVNKHPGLAMPQQPPRLQIAPPSGAMPLQPSGNMVQGLHNVAPPWPPGARWVQPPGHYGVPPGLRPGQAGMEWRQEGAPRSRGF
ncbi:hypothetical protein ACSBR2_037004 [Camellia fascicularis]